LLIRGYVLGSLLSCSLFGIDAFPVVVEVDACEGLPGYHVVGLPATTVREAGVRIHAALKQVGQGLPHLKVTVNLAPADRRKEGVGLDLPIAMAVLAADGRGTLNCVRDLLVLGELGLDGSLRPVRGILAATLLARERGLRGVVVPRDSASEAAVVDGVEVYAPAHLGEVVAAMQGGRPLTCWNAATDLAVPDPQRSDGDLADVRGQEEARLALEVAMAGGHNLLLVGPPGIGKTMLARRVPTIMPPMTRDEALETTKVYSALGQVAGGLIRTRPFRAPHHSISGPALLGGGSPPRPGEVSLAHHGVLFLDELPEFRRETLEALRQPLEDRVITIARVSGVVTLPASFVLVASANPCPCGWLGSRDRTCSCSLAAIERYRHRLSGPLLDRIDMQVLVPNVTLADMRSDAPAESSAAVRERVNAARARQGRRLAQFGVLRNAEMSPAALRQTCRLTGAAERALARLHAVRQGMTGRAIDRLLKVARTIADLSDQDDIDEGCVLEAASYRAFDAEPGTDRRIIA
jgi:magnesium chelatase family protein